MKIKEYISQCIVVGSVLIIFILPFLLPLTWGYFMVLGMFFLLAAYFVVQIFRVCRGFAKFVWGVCICIFLCVGSWGYYDEFNISTLNNPEATFELKHRVALDYGLWLKHRVALDYGLWNALTYSFRFFVGAWAIYFIWKLFKYIAKCDDDIDLEQHK